MTTITADFFKLPPAPTKQSSGSSEAFTLVLGRLKEARLDAQMPASTLQSSAYSLLARVTLECATEDWDGYGAAAISRSVADRARRFLDALPHWMPAPDIVPEADGEIAIEWDLAPMRIFSVSIGKVGPLHFAGLFGKNKELHGAEPFDEEIPEEIGRQLTKLFRCAATN